jgi:hypothetical protein
MAIVIGTGPVSVPTYTSPLVAVCGGNVYYGFPTGGWTEAPNPTDQTLRANVVTSQMFLNLAVYIVDGLDIVVFSLPDLQVEPYLHLVTPQTVANAPTVTTGTTAGGSLPARTYFIEIAYTKADGELAFSPEMTQAVAANQLLTVASPPQDGADVATGYYVYVSETSGSETLQNGNLPIAIGTGYTEPATGISTSTPPEPVGFVPTNCCLTCNWRGRFVLAGDAVNPQNFYMARVGVPTDWNYAALDPAAAVAGNLSESGQIGEPIMALIPYTDDYMLIGCTNSLWMLQGDPADGGSIVRVSDSMGIIGPNAWCVDPMGTVYFIARGGLYSVRPIWEFYQPPQLLSGETYDQYFQALINGQFYVSMQWDIDAKYMHIFGTPVDGTTQGVHLIFDQRNGGLWPQQYPLNHGPTATCKYSANNTNGGARAILLGGLDGNIRQWTNTNLSDDGDAISSYAVLGPVKPDMNAALCSAVTFDFGETLATDTPENWGCQVVINSGPDAFSVTEGTPHSTASIPITLDRRQTTFRQRFRAGWFSIVISNSTINTYWSFESALLEFIQAGRQRDIR